VSKYLLAVAISFLLATCAMAQTSTPIRVKCGGAALKDSKGQAWAADTGFNGGLVSDTTGAVKGTTDQELFQTGRTAPDSGKLVYSFPVANGPYHVNLYFAELFNADYAKGRRVFNVSLEGNPFLQNFDIFGTAGADTALIKGTDVVVSDGHLNIEFDTIAGHDRAKVTAIEIVPGSSTAPQLALNFVYPDGTPVAGKLNYTVTTSQTKMNGSAPLVNGQASAILYAAPQILGLVGQVQLNLSLVDSLGHTLWQIGMTLDSSNANIAGVQSSALSVVVQKAS
jgi:hypothetical protein